MEVYVCFCYDNKMNYTTICKVVDSQEKAQNWAEWATDFESESGRLTFDYELHKVV